MHNLFKPQLNLFILFSLFALLVSPVRAADNKTLALLPLALYTDESKVYLRQGIQNMLGSRLSGEGLTLIADQDLDHSLTDQDKKGVTTPARAEELARKLKADYVIFGSLTALGNGYSLDLSLLDLTQDPLKATKLSEGLSEDQFIPRLSDIAYQFRSIIEGRDFKSLSTAAQPSSSENDFFKPTDEDAGRTLKPTGSSPLNLDLRSFDMADLDKDGQMEFIILAKNKLLIYERKNFALKQTLKTSIGETFVKVTTGDGDQDGVPEIFLVSVFGQSTRTTLYQWSGKALKKTAQMDGHLRILKDSQEAAPPMVLYQNSQMSRFVMGKIYAMKYEQGKWMKGAEINLPKEARFYTLSLINLKGSNQPKFLGLGKGSKLYLWDTDGTVLWNGDESLGGTNNAVRLNQGPIDKDALGQRFDFESPPMILDFDRDGKKEILVIKNIPVTELLQDFISYPTSRLLAYRMEGSGLALAWTSREIPFCSMDMALDGKALFLAAAKAKTTNVGGNTSRLLWFE